MKVFRFLSVFFLSVFISGISAAENAGKKYAVNPPQSTKLFYKHQSSYMKIPLTGEITIDWVTDGKKFSVEVETYTSVFGKIIDTKTVGIIDEYGLEPLHLTERRLAKNPFTVNFDRNKKIISFSDSDTTHNIEGGEQNRTSVVWQIISILRASPKEAVAGKKFSFFVAGHRRGEEWQFQIMGRENVKTPLGDFSAVHIKKLPSLGREQQTTELWLAPELDWLPVRAYFKDPKNSTTEQVIQKIERK